MHGRKLIALPLLLLLATGCRMMTRGSAPSPVSEDESPARFRLRNLSPSNVRSNFQQAIGRAPDEAEARALYAQADQIFQQASDAEGSERRDLFVEAAGKYAEAAQKWPDSMLQEDAMFMEGESYFFADRYKDANTAFGKLVKDYPNTRHIDRIDARRFDIAQYWLAVHRHDPSFFLLPNWDSKLPTNDTFGNAVKSFDRIRLDDPTGRLADDATMAAATAYFAKGDYAKAEQFFADLRTLYPESQHQFEAALLSVKAKMQLYQGSDYDSQDLEEAMKLIELMFQQFPHKVDEHREYLTGAYKEIRVKLAMRDWETAEYYDNRQEYGGAKYYYSKVIREFSDTSLAMDAQKRLAEIADYPDKPPQRAQWLVDNIPKPPPQNGPLVTGNPLKFLRR